MQEFRKNIDRIDLTSPAAVAAEAAILGLAAWVFRSRVLSKDDKQNENKRPPTPLGETIDEKQIYVLNPGDQSFEVGAEDDEGKFISAGGTISTDPDSGELILSVDLISDTDISRLEVLRAKMTELHGRWSKKADLFQ